MLAGNRSVLVVLDSRLRNQRLGAEPTIFAALDHFGAVCEVIDGGDYMSLPPGYVAPRAAYILAHDGAGTWLKPEVAEPLAQAVRDGAGLLVFDRNIGSLPPALRALLPAASKTVISEQLRFPAPPDFVTFGHEQDEELVLNAPLSMTALETGGTDWHPLLSTPAGDCAMAMATAGKGRVVVFGTGNSLFGEEIYGHVRGIDGLLWRALVWVAAKPFPMRCIPPFVSARMDDCNGTYSSFGYVNALNRHGISPNIGLFIDEMGPTDWARARELCDRGGMDVSMHAFRDDFYKARPNYHPYAVAPDKPDLSDGGRTTLFEGLSMDHVTGAELDEATVEHNFHRMDTAFAAAGLRHSRVLNAHFGEIGYRAVSRFLARGVDMPCNFSMVGQLYGNQPVWRPRPYAVRGLNARHALAIDRCPRHPGMTFISISAAHMGRSHMTSDILSGNVPFLGEADHVQREAAAERAIANVRLGLDALAFGVIMTHEERIDAISLTDWEWIVDTTMQGVTGWDWVGAGREQVSVICKRLFDSALVGADFTNGTLHCGLSGRTDGPSPLTIWRNEGDACRRTCVDVAGFDGFCEINVPA
jgi:hypothetical protein